ncbi:DUF2842 domain-containing protein [Flavimaricola marinus]|uniref:DUF2842 domain-containing protein n=1 Tax=Flavimaricola marinus TaxID=1819565 RepID=A0A238LJD3_9RHOB|nr:DUF2842 domain-containing protein [Flavimaricola marinus]SMY09514.1 hypothetical protein LOM8899_03681 [Flavimaricola marinus]
MALSHKAKKRWSLLILLVGIPLYVLVVMGVMGFVYDTYGQPPFLVELAIYVGLGVLWAIPLKRVFMGVGQADPNDPPQD